MSKGDDSWGEWMAAAQDGDLQSYERLLTELETALRNFLRRKLGDAELAEECLQESLLAIHRARHTYDPARPLRPWVYALASYRTIDVLRRRSTRRRHEDPGADAGEAADASARPEIGVDVARALEDLDPRQREAVLLTKLQGYTLEEAAERAGVSRAAMRSRVHRGIGRLRRALGRGP